MWRVANADKRNVNIQKHGCLLYVTVLGPHLHLIAYIIPRRRAGFFRMLDVPLAL